MRPFHPMKANCSTSAVKESDYGEGWGMCGSFFNEIDVSGGDYLGEPAAEDFSKLRAIVQQAEIVAS